MYYILRSLILISYLLIVSSVGLSRSRNNRNQQSDHFHHNTLLSTRQRHYVDVGPLKNIWGRRDDSFDEDEDEISPNSSTPNIRLPLEVTPIHYFLEIIPILDNETETLGKIWTAPGNVKILVDALKPEKTITLHALKLNISEVQVISRKTGDRMKLLSHNYSEVIHDQYVISLENELIVGDMYEIGLTYVAPISLNRADGLYRSQYKDPESNQTVYLASTQCEFFSARQILPCFDEPAIKSTFDIAIGRSAKHKTLSNSNLVSTVPLLGTFGWYIDSYNTTVVMPAYLVAFIVSEYTYAEADPSILKNRPVRVYGPEHLIDEGAGEFGAEVSAKVLAYYETYFDSEYPLPKMDSAAVPGFQHGAMENYGLNIYREVLLLNYPGISTEQQRATISSVIAHESAHQYFGNLVTCKWWNNIWLNEGFATYYSYFGQNATNPEYEPLKQLLTDGPQYALALDSRERSSYPLLLTAKTQNGLENQAIGLPYYKGASLIRMMSGFLTSQTFEKGIRKYLKKWSYKAAEQDDLFQVLTEQAHLDGTLPENMSVKEIMDPWTKQRGYPLVRVISSDNDTIYVLYERFQSSQMIRSDKHFSWPIPISVATQDDPNFENHFPKFWIPEGSVVKTMKHDVSKWIVVNPEATGFYRVQYDRKLTKLLQNQMNTDHTVISPFSRSQILDDYFSLASQMDIPISSALEFTKYFAKETEEISWLVFMKNIRQLFFFYTEQEVNNSTTPMPNFESFQAYILPRLEGALEIIGLEQPPKEKGAKVIFRSKLLNWACRLGSKMCLDYAKNLFEMWHTKPEVNPVPVDLRSFMYCYGVAAGGPLNWLLAFENYANKSTDLRTSLLLAKSLGCVKDQGYLMIVFESLLDGSMTMNSYGMRLLFHGAISNPVGRPVVINFLKSHMGTMKQRFNSTANEIFLQIFSDFSDYLHTEEDLLEVQNLIQSNSEILKEIRYPLEVYASDISDNINWMSKHFEPMKIWFDEQQLSSKIK